MQTSFAELPKSSNNYYCVGLRNNYLGTKTDKSVLTMSLSQRVPCLRCRAQKIHLPEQTCRQKDNPQAVKVKGEGEGRHAACGQEVDS